MEINSEFYKTELGKKVASLKTNILKIINIYGLNKYKNNGVRAHCA
jgi:hypothetical protein